MPDKESLNKVGKLTRKQKDSYYKFGMLDRNHNQLTEQFHSKAARIYYLAGWNYQDRIIRQHKPVLELLMRKIN